MTPRSDWFTLIRMSSIANARRTRLKEQIESVRLDKYGPPPVNYLKTLRENEQLTLDELSRRMGISKHALIRLEQGTYESILPAALAYYVTNFTDSELTLVEQYEEYQRLMRNRNHLYFGLDLEIIGAYHPFRELRHRIDVTPTEVAKALCIPQATIVHFEKHVKQQQSVPKCIANVLHEIGYKHEQIMGFVEAYSMFRSKALGTNVRKIR